MEYITSRAVMGMLQRAMSIDSSPSWVNLISNKFTSDQASEDYPWLSAAPVMREWVGQRQAKGFSENKLTIENKHFEATLEVLKRDLRRDKLGALTTRISELSQRATTHEASLLSTLIVGGESGLCYDGQYFFDTDHSEGDSGTQSNDISVDISALAVATHGTTTAPAVAEFQLAIALAVQQIASFVDDKGEPMNETAQSFLVMVPMVFMNTALEAVSKAPQMAETQTVLNKLQSKFSISVEPNVRLSSWTTKFAVFRADSPVKPLIRQQETNINIAAKAEGSEFEFDNDAHQYGIDIWRNVAYGRWQNACLVTLA